MKDNIETRFMFDNVYQDNQGKTIGKICEDGYILTLYSHPKSGYKKLKLMYNDDSNKSMYNDDSNKLILMLDGSYLFCREGVHLKAFDPTCENAYLASCHLSNFKTPQKNVPIPMKIVDTVYMLTVAMITNQKIVMVSNEEILV